MSLKVLKSARLISILTLASRLLGLLRDMSFSYAFGAGSVQSAFQLAFHIPNLFRKLLGEGALSAASIPVFAEMHHRQDHTDMDAVAGRLMGLLLLVLTGLCVIGELVVVTLFVYFRQDDYWSLVLGLTVVMLPYMILVCLAANLGGIQNVFGRFGLPAALPILMNVFLIVAVAAIPLVPGGPRQQIVLPAAMVLVAGAVQLALQWRAVRKCGLTLKLSLDRTHPAIRQIGLTMIPMAAGLGAVQLNTFLDSLIASWFVLEPDGQRPGAAILYFAQRLYHFPLGVFLLALATALFPALSRYAAQNDLASLSRTLARGIRATLFIAIPCMVGLILVSQPLVRALFDYGKFKESPDADIRVAFALTMYALGLWAYGLNHLVVRAFYATKDATTPLKVAVATVVLNLTLNLILVQTSLREAGLALATAISATVQLLVLLILLRKRLDHISWSPIAASAVRTLLAATLMGWCVWAVGNLNVLQEAEPLRLAAMVATGGVSYLLAVRILRCQEVHELLRH